MASSKLFQYFPNHFHSFTKELIRKVIADIRISSRDITKATFIFKAYENFSFSRR